MGSRCLVILPCGKAGKKINNSLSFFSFFKNFQMSYTFLFCSLSLESFIELSLVISFELSSIFVATIPSFFSSNEFKSFRFSFGHDCSLHSDIETC